MKDIIVYLEDIYDSCVAIESFVKNISSENDFLKNDLVSSAVINKLSIIGEAVKKIPYETRRVHSEIPWRDIAGTRDLLIHSYHNTSLRKIWIDIRKDIPELKKNIKLIIDSMK